MTVSNIKATFECDVQKVWDILTSLENYSWRSDISNIEIKDNKEFVEYTKDEYATYFKVTVFEKYKRWEFDLENSNIKGHWTGIFSYNNGRTTIDFTENVVAKKLVMKPLVGMYLKKQQARYIEDLKKVING